MTAFAKDDLKLLHWNDYLGTELEKVEEGEWIAHHKSETKDMVFKDLTTGKNYVCVISRYPRGEDYEYDWDLDPNNTINCPEVKKVETTTHAWEKVSSSSAA